MDQEKTLTAVLTFMRHGEKDDTGALTHAGHLQAKQSGLTTVHLNGDIILFHSGVGRVKNTIRSMAAHLHLSEGQEELLELGEHIADYKVPTLHYSKDPKNNGEYFTHWDDIEHTPKNIQNRMDSFLSLGHDSTEPDMYFSPEEMARNIADIIDTEIRFANVTDSMHRVNFINGSHEPVLTSFIYYFLSDYAPQSTELIKSIGGPIDFAESFDIYIWQVRGRAQEIEFRFRDISKTLILDSLRQFIISK
ncbi:MAG: hypothetical protein ABI716_01875 [Candidatus Saccharibacteria bacterium]